MKSKPSPSVVAHDAIYRSRCRLCWRAVAACLWLLAAGPALADDLFPKELVDFIADPKEPVFTGAGPGQWDARIRERGWIMREGGLYRMWYTGFESDSSPLLKLGYATSSDGIHWTRYDKNPVYGDHWTEDMMVVRHEGTYYMFAEGKDDLAQLLTSADGIAWKRVGQLDVRKKNGEPIEPGPYGTPTAWFENGVWHLFYERRDLGIWLATSHDLKVWTNVQDEPVIPLGPADYDKEQVALNQIVKHNGRYYAYYHGAGAPLPGTRRRLWCTCVATSKDLIHWDKYEKNPLFPLEENKSSGILVHDGQRYLLYTMHDQVHRHVPQSGGPGEAGDQRSEDAPASLRAPNKTASVSEIRTYKGGFVRALKAAADQSSSKRPANDGKGHQPRPLPITGSREGIIQATVTGPQFHAPELFQGFEDYYHPRLKRLREEYKLDEVVEGEPDEFRRILKLRHWVHSRWPIDNDQNFSGDAFAILEKAKTGCGFNCSHSMTVQQAALSALGYVARNVLVDRNHEDLGRSLHHGVNEVWSNDYAKWVLLDAKYDIHFERNGVPLSALELHEAVRADGGRGIVMLRGVERREVPMDDSRPPARPTEATIRSYWWVSYPLRQNPFTQPHFAARERLVIFDNEAFRQTTWYRDHGAGLTKHWAYAAGAFVPTADRTQIEWTPGVTVLRVRRVAPAELDIEFRSATPNFEAYVVRHNGGAPQIVTDDQVRWKLEKGENTLEVRSRNLFGVLGAPVTATAEFSP